MRGAVLAGNRLHAHASPGRAPCLNASSLMPLQFISPLMTKTRLQLGLLLGAAAAVGSALGATPESWAGDSPLEVARRLDQAFVQVSEQATRSVVVIQVTHPEGRATSMEEVHPFWEFLPPEFRGQMEKQWQEWQKHHEGSAPPMQVSSQGSGIIIRTNGFILTNRHVVEGAESITVRLHDGRRLPATLQGEDIQSDLAILKVKADDLPAARLGDSSRVRVGQFAIAIGAPFELDYTVTFGHVSALGRSYLLADASMDQDFIQTDANINPGNSGGPLVNIDGEVIGINTLIRGLQTGIGFAVPIDLAREVASSIIEHGRYQRAWLGIGIESVRRRGDLQALKGAAREGVLVTLIREDGPAYRSALRAGDIITGVEETRVRNEAELKAAIRNRPINEPVTLQVRRVDDQFEGHDLQIRVKPAPWPETLFPIAVARPSPVDPMERVGLKAELFTRQLAEWFRVEKTRGVILTSIQPGSVAAVKGLQPGDIITEVNQTPVSTPGELREVLRQADLAKGITVNFISKGTAQFVILKEMGD